MTATDETGKTSARESKEIVPEVWGPKDTPYRENRLADYKIVEMKPDEWVLRERVKNDMEIVVSYVAGILTAEDIETAFVLARQAAEDLRMSERGWSKVCAAFETRNAVWKLRGE